MSTKREEIIAATCRLLELQGYRATGMNEIVRESAAPKGSLYHYFPEGKDELVTEAIAASAATIVANITGVMAEHADAAVAIPAFVRRLAGFVAASDFRQGGPITAVALESASTNERLRLACRDAYRAWRRPFADKLRPAYGPRAERLAALIIAAIEGGIVLARSERSEQPLLDVADEIEALLGIRS
jgi:TetR/AcrR family transcriptional repressor of lmrAB and yxaGH operons